MSEASDIAAMAIKAGAGSVLSSADGRSFLLVPEGLKHIDVSDEHGLNLKAPHYVKQSVTLQTQDSVVEYVNRFKGAQTVLFADIDANSIVGQIDYHDPKAASNVAHRASLVLPYSEEWKLWNGISGKLQDQLTFARFIEENAADISVPSAGDLLDAVRDLQVHRKVNFTKAVRTASDNENFSFTDETETRTKQGDLELPTKFVVGLPVYFGEPDTEVHAFLRWKIDADKGGLFLGIQLHRVEHVRQAVFKQIVTAISERTGCLAVFGKL